MVFSIGVVNFSVLCQQQTQQTGVELMTMAMNDTSSTCTKCAKCQQSPSCQKNGGCCQDKAEVMKVDLDQSVAKSQLFNLSAEQFALLQALIPTFLFEQGVQTIDADLANHSSIPLGKAVPINILNCVYRI